MSTSVKPRKKKVKKVSKSKTKAPKLEPEKLPYFEDKTPYFDEHYELVNRVNICQNGEICTIRVKQDKCLVAGKFVTPVLNPYVKREYRIHCLLDHQNVIKAFESFAYMKPGYSISLRHEVLVMEYADGGTLYHHIAHRNGGFNPSQIPGLILQITEGLAYIHDRGFIHRDIKPANILMVNGTPKIADFGLAVAISPNRYKRFTGVLGTAPYHAPEMLAGIHYDKRYDVWSLGVTITVMVLGKNIFGINGASHLTRLDKRIDCLKKILQKTGVPKISDFRKLRSSETFMYANFPPLPPEQPYFLEFLRETLGNAGHDFLMRCLTVAPRRRYTSQQLLNHPYLASLIGY
uniref:Protein kinase domain-containing protein n=1 Tax=Panagrellus redivivus TaxID=6233 RepID=A0A7E4USA8_PANRE